MPTTLGLTGGCSLLPEEEDELASEGFVSMADAREGGGGAKTTRCAINSGTTLKGASGSNCSVRTEIEKDCQKNMYTHTRARPMMNMESIAWS